MNPTASFSLPHRRASHYRRLMCVGLVVALSFGCYRKPTIRNQPRKATASSDRFQPSCDNTGLDIAYVDDQTCAECHEEIAARFAKHPMGNSLEASSELSESKLLEKFTAASNATFSRGHFEYSAEWRDQKLFHRRSLQGEESDPTIAEEHEVAFVVGSGQKGRSYLIEDGSHLFMSPLTWYPEKQVWDLSPGYEHNDLGFRRPVLEDCLFCHSNRANVVADQKNKYETPVFHGHAIGCQRCHGPGQLHVEKQLGEVTVDQATPDYDRSIANPIRMKPSVREAVCQQCHLAGAARIVKAKKSRFDFRPGTPLEDTIATFVLNPDLPQNENHFVGQVEQMYESRCFTQSKGKLGCISCHDPHSVPEPKERIAFYRKRCLACHTEASCGEPVESRRDASGRDNCIACHMPSIETDVRHASSTDHRVPRQVSLANQTREAGRHGSAPIIAFPPGGAKPNERDLAIGLLETSTYYPTRVPAADLLKAASPLSRYVASHRGDSDGYEALGDILLRSNFNRAVENYDRVLARSPQREHAMVMRANFLLSQKGEVVEAIRQWQKIIEIHPAVASYHLKLCETFETAGRWRELTETAELGAKLFPTTGEFYRYLVVGNVAIKETSRAQAALEVLIRFHDSKESELRAWYGGL